MGASLLAIAMCQSTSILTDPTPSRASSLPQLFDLGCPAHGAKTRPSHRVPQPNPKTFKTNAYSSATSRNPW
nr:hypothetical protein C1892_25080 [Pseudomonas sp. MPBD7-1]